MAKAPSPERYTTFKLVGMSESGLTKIWNVYNPENRTSCGLIKWHGGFRKYAFFPENDFRFDSGCLKMIAAFLDDNEHRSAKQQEKKAKVYTARACSNPALENDCSGCTDLRDDPMGGTHQGCTKQHGHVGCKLDKKRNYDFKR